ncbi:methyltransferase domain-containing protein [Sphaerisporangium sp. TRM90804]|uniref:class I SAM-dependent methyltransferase n=1 Tax=Sphaerisporangium sp. TRM90804 TaxID=3031113 RepID=UPI00244BAE0A|nr:methyltransferase domain-containing protein [Sphaerisporangium sp. TRM90804]MDH2428444.1 methyltransferase domain-containing protein [Sphaerisporangium sp. TRM90804]
MTIKALLRQPYLPGLPLGDYLDQIGKRFPDFGRVLWFDRKGAAEALAGLSATTNEFETNDDDGRGDSYRRAQLNRMIRARGMRTLFTLAAGVPDMESIPPGWTLLDLLGGDGLLARVFATMAPRPRHAVITSDMAGHMVAAALHAGLPAIRQQAQFLFMRDESVDAALLAYGTHHIAPEDRLGVCQEAARVLRPGGRLVLHDFEAGAPAALWFSEVVHRYSKAGHSYHHFTAAEMAGHLKLSGLGSVLVRRVYDPLVVRGGSAAEARNLLADYLFDMYGLTGLAFPQTPLDDLRQTVWKLARYHFAHSAKYAPDDAGSEWKREPAVYRDGAEWVAEIPRVALVAVGEK